MADKKGLLKGFETNSTFLQCLSLAKSLAPDLLLLTGDVSEDGSLAFYQRIKHYLAESQIEYLLIPGNHDNIKNMKTVFNEKCYLNQTISVNHWNLILLNSVIEDEIFGRVSDDGLRIISQTLESGNAPTAIFLHHHPVKMQSTLMDQYALQNPEALFSSCQGYEDHVKFVCCGHVHQEFASEVNGIKFYATPSTSMQFKPKMTKLEFDPVPPGIRIFTLNKEGHFTTGVVRV